MHKYCTINSIISQEKNANYLKAKKNANYLKAEKTTKNVKKVSNNVE